jgi:hypothetical protein
MKKIQKIAVNRRFPKILPPANSKALCLFGCAYYGINDIANIYEAGIESISINDIELDKLNQIDEYYENFSFIKYPGDAFLLVEKFIKDDKKFDIVTADPFSNLYPKVHNEFLTSLLKITQRQLIVGIDGIFLKENGIMDDTNGLKNYYQSIFKLNINVVELINRSTHRENTYWVSIDNL